MNWWAILITLIIAGAMLTSGMWAGEKHPSEWIHKKCGNTMMNCRCGYE